MILVTGATGLLGSHILYDLTQKGYRVRALYRNQDRIKQVEQLFDYYSNDKSHSFHTIVWVQGDVLDMVSLEDAFQGIEQVYHCAALVSFKKRDFKQLIHVNRLGTANVVNFCLKFNVKKLAHVSSTAAIGGIEGSIVTEETKWQIHEKTSGYAISKYNSEREVWRGQEEGLEVVIINPCVIFGAGQLNESSLTIFNSVRKGLKVYSPGSNAFVDARDVSSCLIQLMESDTSAERYLCIGENLSFKTILDEIARQFKVKAPFMRPPQWLAKVIAFLNENLSKITGTNPSITIESARSAYSNTTYSNAKIKQELNHEFIGLQESVANVVNFYHWLEKEKGK